MSTMNQETQKRILAFDDTIVACTSNKPTTKKYEYKIEDKGITQRYNINDEFIVPIHFEPTCPIYVLNQDCIIAAQKVSIYGKTCLLNMASAKNVGGGVRGGEKAQEEDLCRRSNLYPSLSEVKYPIPDDQILYTKNVMFFKAPDYSYIPVPFKTDVVSVASVRLSMQRYLTDTEKHIIVSKIRLMFLAMYVNGIRVPIVSALGCGAYRNNPMEISQLFTQILIDERVAGLFDKIVFAIIDDQNSNGNFGVFSEKFSPYTQDLSL